MVMTFVDHQPTGFSDAGRVVGLDEHAKQWVRRSAVVNALRVTEAVTSKR